MTFVKTLLQRYGFFAPSVDTSEIFGHRLDRLEIREGRREVRTSAFGKDTLRSPT
ncbi:MAG: hypothetical protein K9G71_10720 [Rhodobacteraceae bacterium]|jgi:hypothetical protein|nr:hypothetical protein [Paracoccaceae bacterium]MCF8514827.1 hypothetical protein [Paracoccaceae bacterium]MCF8519071.1 hypothetical protein [Paracoccaceae bacterium]